MLFLVFRQTPLKVSLSTGGAPVERILKELSALSGTPLKAGDRVRDDILIVQAVNVPLEELLVQIAAADGAEWEKKGTTRELTRSTKLADQQEKAELALRIVGLKSDLERQAKLVAQPMVPGASPDSDRPRVARKALLTLGAGEFASLPGAVCVVFSDQPNLIQRQWPGPVSGLVPGSFQSVAMTANFQTSTPSIKAFTTEDPGPPPTINRRLISISKSIFDGYSVKVTFLDAKNLKVGVSETSFFPSAVEELMRPPSEVSGDKSAPLELSPISEEFRAVLNAATSNRPTAMSPALQSRILDPDRFDPLSFVVGDGFASIAKRRGCAVVAAVPDFAFIAGIGFSMGKMTETRFLNWIANMCEIDQSNPRWMVVRPLLPIEARTLRTNRKALGELNRKAWKNGGLTLADLGDYANAEPHAYFETISPFYAFLLMPEVAQMIQPNALGALRLYARLNETQRRRLESGGQVVASDLTPEGRAQLQDWIFNENAFPFGHTMLNPMDATDAFPDGRVSDVVLTGRVSLTDIVLPMFGDKSALDMSPLNAESLGYEMAREDQGKARVKAPMSKFRLGKKALLVLEAKSASYQTSAEMMETRMDRSATPFTFAQLPEGFRKTAEQMRKQANANPEAPPKFNPPPP